MSDQTIRLKIDQRPALNCRVIPRYPVSVIGTSGVLVSMVNGVLVISADIPAINANVDDFAVAPVFDGSGSVLTTGIKVDVRIPISCLITGWSILADQVGSVVFDIWKDSYGNYPPVVADTITAAAKPTLASAAKNEDSTLAGWTKSVTAGDTLRFNIDSAATLTRATLTLNFTRT